MSVGTHLACARCKHRTLRSVRGRYGSPVKVRKGTVRLMSCAHCGMRNMIACIVVNKKNADPVERLLEME